MQADDDTNPDDRPTSGCPRRHMRPCPSARVRADASVPPTDWNRIFVRACIIETHYMQ